MNSKLTKTLIDIETLDKSFIIHIVYSTNDNFIGKRVYSINKCVLLLETAKKLINANNDFKKLGYTLKILDAYRPLSVQKLMWDILPDDNFVAPPYRGSMHNRGCAVDVTLVDTNGYELEMPSTFDDFSEKAWITYDNCDKRLIENRELLSNIMVQNGFKTIETEWWHFYDPENTAAPLLDISFDAIK